MSPAQISKHITGLFYLSIVSFMLSDIDDFILFVFGKSYNTF